MDSWAYLNNKFQNEDIGKGLRVTAIENKMRGNNLHWFGHVQMR